MIYSLCSSNKDNLVQHHRILEERNVLIQTFKHFFKVLELPVEKKIKIITWKCIGCKAHGATLLCYLCIKISY